MKKKGLKLFSFLLVFSLMFGIMSTAYAATSVNGEPVGDVTKDEAKRLKEVDKIADQNLKKNNESKDNLVDSQAFYDHTWYTDSEYIDVAAWGKKISSTVGMYVTDYTFAIHVEWDGYNKAFKDAGSPSSPYINLLSEVWVTGLGISFSGTANWTPVTETKVKKTTSGASSTGVNYTGFTADGVLWSMSSQSTADVYVGGQDYVAQSKVTILF